MMGQAHPSEIELLEEVEGELEHEQSAAIRAHVETCAVCAASLAELERARSVLRASPLLEPPAARVSEIAASLLEQERVRRRWLFFRSSPRRLAVVLVPVAAAIVAVVVVTTNGGNGGPTAAPAPNPERGAAPAEAQTAQAFGGEAAPPNEPAPPPSAKSGTTTTAPSSADNGATAAAAPETTLEAVAAPIAVKGPASEVQALLEQDGFAAKVIDETTVEVTGAEASAVESALKARAPGTVHVVVKPG